MKYPTKKNSRGVSIIEIVVSMVLIFLVMLVLAFVYPQGRRVTQGSDNRTKATEIAKSIMEEIQLIPLLPQSWATANSTSALKDISLVRTSDKNNYTTLDIFAGNYSAMTTLKWPYHHRDNWDAGTDIGGNLNSVANCPFFIYNSGNLDDKIRSNLARPFFISTSQLISQGANQINIPKGIVVSPSTQTPAINRKNPIIATITVSVAWAETSTIGTGNRKGFKYNYVSLINTRTENIY